MNIIEINYWKKMQIFLVLINFILQNVDDFLRILLKHEKETK